MDVIWVEYKYLLINTIKKQYKFYPELKWIKACVDGRENEQILISVSILLDVSFKVEYELYYNCNSPLITPNRSDWVRGVDMFLSWYRVTRCLYNLAIS